MELGFMTNVLVKHGMKTLEEVAKWGKENGFRDLEVGPALPLEEAAYRAVLDGGGMKISALTYCRNFLSGDEQEAKTHIEQLKKRVEFAGALGIEKVVTSTGIDKSVEEGVYDRADSIRKIPARSLDAVERVFAPIVQLAEDKGVKICFENCPLMGNIAISPLLWEGLLGRLESPGVGLAFDPSHLVWQMIDPYAAIERFAGKIFHVHAKDTRVNRERLASTGILTDFSWWNYCIPGDGELDWQRIFAALRQAGYDGAVSIEHEDPAYEADLSAVKDGMIKGKEYIESIWSCQTQGLKAGEVKDDFA